MHPIQRIIDPAHHIIIADLTIIPGRRLDTKPVQRSQSLIAYHHCHIIFLLKIHQMAIRTEPKLSFIRCPARKSLRLGLHHQIIIMLQAADHIYHSEKPARERADLAGNGALPSGDGGRKKMSEKLELLHTDRVLIVEGKYDAARLSHLTDAMILLTDGFGIYKDKKRQQLFKQLAHKNGLILLTDSDAAGFRIRTYITNLVGEKNVVQAYVPAIHGKEKRKAQPGKEGLLGVEGVDDALVLQALRDALGEEAGISPAKPEGRQITYTDLYEWGLSGTAGSAERKTKLLCALGLPPRLSKKELVEALNRLYSYEQLDEMQSELLET